MKIPNANTLPKLAREVTRFSFSVEEGARAIGIGRSLMFRLIRDKEINVVRIGRRTLVPVRECEAYLQRLLELDHHAASSADGPKIPAPPEVQK